MIIIMLGAPGTGKGTVAGLLQEKLGIKQVSTGDIFRKNIKEKTELGKIAEEYIAQGKLVPDDITIKIIEDRLNEPDVEKGIILDGFPRTVRQAEALDKILEEKEFSYTANGAIKVTLKGNLEMVDVEILDEELLKEKEDLIVMIKLAYNGCKDQINDAEEELAGKFQQANRKGGFPF